MRLHHRLHAWSGQLSVRLTLWVALFAMLLAAFLMIADSREGEAIVRERILTKTSELGGVVAAFAGPYLDRGRAVELGAILEDFAREGDLRDIEVVDRDGGIVADGDPRTGSQTGAPRRSTASGVLASALVTGRKVTEVADASVEAAFPIRVGARIVGAVRLNVSLDEAASAGARLRRRSLALSLALLALTLPLAGLLMARATRPIRDLTTAARRIALGDLKASVDAVSDGEVGELQSAIQHMVKSLKHGRDEVERLAFTDAVTELPNRQAFRQAAERVLKKATSRASGALLFIDLDLFKTVNDTLGHDAGDELLRAVCERLQEGLRFAFPTEAASEMPVLARLGGDEFTILLPRIRSRADAEALGEWIVAEIDRPFLLRDQEVGIGASVGIALFPGDGTAYDVLLKNADIAMYAAKEAGRGTVRFYKAGIDHLAQGRLMLEQEIRAGLAAGEFEVFYQPKVACSDGRIIGAEALVRWRHPKRGLLPPGAFIGLAEETGLVVDIGWHVLSRATADIAPLAAEGWPLSIAVNVAARQFEHADFVSRVVIALARSGLPAPLLELEFTETMAMRDPERLIHRLTPLRERGVRFAIDDFGTGYSSLSYLTRLPIDTVKIDRSFVQALVKSTNDRKLVMMILRMAESLKLKTVAEGIENEHELAFLRKHGTSSAQGYLFSPALPFDEFAHLYRASRAEQIPLRAARILSVAG